MPVRVDFQACFHMNWIVCGRNFSNQHIWFYFPRTQVLQLVRNLRRTRRKPCYTVGAVAEQATETRCSLMRMSSVSSSVWMSECTALCAGVCE